MRTILQEKVTIHCNITTWFTNLYYASSNEDSGCKNCSGQGMEKLETIPAWHLGKVKSEKEVILGSTKRAKNNPLCYVDGQMSSQECGVRTKIKKKKIKSRVVLRGDIVKDDSGAYAVFFSERGSSASQMTAAKVLDVIARLPGCDGQAADAVSAYITLK